MREVAVVGFTQSPCMRREPDRNEVEILIPVLRSLREETGVSGADCDFVCSGSSDYLAGQSFAFVSGLDAVGAWPPARPPPGSLPVENWRRTRGRPR